MPLPTRQAPQRSEPGQTASGPAGPRRIHEVAAELGLTARAIRYYEQMGLLRPARSGGAYRLYDESDVERLRAIQALRDDAGFSLADISQLLADQDAANDDRAAYDATADPAERRRLLADALAREGRHVALLRDKVARLAAMLEAAEERRARLRAKAAEL
ncbi:MAG TPA: MerR family transcriptional regulator [Candidatus Sulfotelmatobacter sp.]|nr:MerR family transcriptional regulator [Candidatus Sulfotelmatobacter sp.]